jgi:alpha-ketoglutarate-dependent taurine dioxygenase
VDFLAESDAVGLSSSLAEHYDLIVVPTHLEYVTEAEYDTLAHYRDQGGDLIFLASNDLYWKVDIDGGSMHRAVRWRQLDRPEAGLVGAQYAGSKTGDAAPYIVGDSSAAAWAFEGTGLSTSDLFSYAGAEFDVRTAASPPDTQLLATVRTPTHRGEMTYYDLGEAKVFAPGTFFSGRVLRPEESRLLENVWNHSDAPDLPKGPGASR